MGFRLNKQGNDKLYIRLHGRRTSLLCVHVLAPQVICQHENTEFKLFLSHRVVLQ